MDVSGSVVQVDTNGDGIIDSTLDGTGRLVTGTVDTVGDAATKIIDTTSGILGKAYEGGKTAVGDAYGATKTAVGDVYGEAKSTAGDVYGEAKELTGDVINETGVRDLYANEVENATLRQERHRQGILQQNGMMYGATPLSQNTVNTYVGPGGRQRTVNPAVSSMNYFGALPEKGNNKYIPMTSDFSAFGR